MAHEEYIQIGVTAMRGPGGEFLPAVPLYIKAEDSAQAGEETLIHDIGRLLARRMKAYVDGCGRAGIMPEG